MAWYDLGFFGSETKEPLTVSMGGDTLSCDGLMDLPETERLLAVEKALQKPDMYGNPLTLECARKHAPDLLTKAQGTLARLDSNIKIGAGAQEIINRTGTQEVANAVNTTIEAVTDGAGKVFGAVASGANKLLYIGAAVVIFAVFVNAKARK